jgi:serine/threonine protein kinase
MANSQISEHDTRPNTPDEFTSTSVQYNGDFARLIPTNALAKIAFDELARLMRTEPEWNHHARRSIHVEHCLSSPSPAILESDTDGEVPQKPTPTLTGYYRLNLLIPPHDHRFGWFLGSGRRDLGDAGVDFLLTAQRRQYRVAGRHARLSLHPETAVLLLTVDNGRVVILNGQEELRNGSRAICTLSTGIMIGDLAYKLVYTELDDDLFREQLSTARIETGQTGLAPPATLATTPSNTDQEYQGYIIQSPFAYGTEAIVSAGIDRRTGEAVAVKKVQRKQANTFRIRAELELMKTLKPHVSFRTLCPRYHQDATDICKSNLCSLVEVLYSGGDEHDIGQTTVNEVYQIYRPLGRHTFEELNESDRPEETRLVLFHDCIRGLAHLHENGIMHRDIKPSNLAVVSYDPLRAMVMDFGTATKESTSTNHFKGTIVFLAPEVMCLKNGEEQAPPYSRAVDIWALGVSGYMLFAIRRKSIWWGKEGSITHAVHHRMRQHLAPILPGTISSLIDRMIKWNSEYRPSAIEALHDEVWPAEDPHAASTNLFSASLGSKRPLQ